MNNNLLTLRLEHKKPVELVDLSLALLAVGSEFSRFNQLSKRGEPEAKLYLQQVHNGSIIADLVPIVAQGHLFMDSIDTVKLFVERVVHLLQWLLGERERPENVDKKQLDQMALFVEPVAKDSGAHWQIHHNNEVHIHINHVQANAVQNGIRREKELMKEPVSGLHQQVVLVFKQTRDDPQVGNRGVIESISKNSVKTVFSDDAVHDAMLLGEENPLTGGYLVDVRVETIDDKPTLYNVRHFYERIE